MKTPSTGFGLFAATTLVLALTAGPAAAESLVPPGNSAATQYTETFPSAGGGRNAERGDGLARDRSPAETLGAKRARRLQAQGEAGAALAEAVAETAPAGPSTGSAGRAAAAAGEPTGAAPTPTASTPTRPGSGEEPPGEAPLPAGASAFGEVASQATGASTAGIGAVLPLAVLGAFLWALAYLVLRRRRPSR